MATLNCKGVWETESGSEPRPQNKQGLPHTFGCVWSLCHCSLQVRCELDGAGSLVRRYFYQWFLLKSKFAQGHCLTILQSLGWRAESPSGHLAERFPDAHPCFNAAFHSRSQQNPAPAPRGPWRAPRPSHPQDSGAGPWACGNKDSAQHLPAPHLPGKGLPTSQDPPFKPRCSGSVDTDLSFLDTFRNTRNRNETQISLIPKGNLL